MKVKNFFRTLLAVMVAVIMSFSVAIFAGCEDDEEAGVPNNSVTPEKPENGGGNQNSGNNGNSGNSEKPDKPTTPDKPVTPDKPDEPDEPDEPLPDIGGTLESAELLQYLLNQETPYAGINMLQLSESVTNGYQVSEDGSKLNDGYSYKLSSYEDKGINAKINLVNGSGDITYSESSTNYREITELGETHKSDYSNAQLKYYFLRSWNLFSYQDYGEQSDSLVEIDDFTGKTFNWMGEYNDLENSLTGPNNGAEAAYIADALGAFTVENGKATADFNLAAYNLVRIVKSVLNLIEITTTVGGVLANDSVKTLIETFTASLTPAEMQSYVISAIEQLSATELEDGVTVGDMLEAMEIDVASYIVEPDENSTVYEYIVKIVSSKQLKNLINKIMEVYGKATGKIVVPMPVTLDKMSVNAMLIAAGTSLNEVKTAFNDFTKGITKTEFKVTVKNSSTTVQDNSGNEHSLEIPTEATYSFTNLKLDYTLNGNTLTQLNFNCDYTYSGTELDAAFEVDNNTGETSAVEIILCEVESAGKLTLKVEFPSTAYTLENVDKNEIEIVQKEWTDECNGNKVTFSINASDVGLNVNTAPIKVYATVSVENGEVNGVTFTDENDYPITVDGEGKITVEITYWDYTEDDGYGEYTEYVSLYVNTYEENGAYCVFLTLEPVENAGANDLSQAVASGYFYKSNVYYVNTVEGIVNGEPAHKAAETISEAA